MIAAVEESNTKVEGFRRLRFADAFELLVNDNDGFFNATTLCALKGKKLRHYQEGKRFKELEVLLQKSLEFGDRVRYTSCDLGYAKESAISGTYFHPILLLALANRCSEEFYVKAAIVVNAFFDRTAERRALFNRTFAVKCAENDAMTAVSSRQTTTDSAADNTSREIIPTDSDTVSPFSSLRMPSTSRDVPKYDLTPSNNTTRLMYAGLELLVDERKWFNALKFCNKHTNNKRLIDFSRDKKIANLIEHITTNLQIDPVRLSLEKFEKNSPNYGTFYHPLLFLALASWVSVDFFIKSSKIVFMSFSSCDIAEIMDLMAQDEPAGANTIAMGHDSLNTIIDNASTSDVSAKTETNSTFTWIDECSSSSCATDVSQDVDSTSLYAAEKELDRREWFLRMETLKKEYEHKMEMMHFDFDQTVKKIKEEGAEKDRQLQNIKTDLDRQAEVKNREIRELQAAREREVDELRNARINELELKKAHMQVEMEKNTYFLRSNEQKLIVDDLTRRLAELELSNGRLRVSKLKRNLVEEKHNSIRDIYKAPSGIDRLEMLVIARIGLQQYYGFRRKLKGLFGAINRRVRLDEDGAVELWFVSNNAKQDFLDCKTHLNKVARENYVEIETNCNIFAAKDRAGCDLDMVGSLREFAGLVGLIELDAGFMQRVLKCAQSTAAEHQCTAVEALKSEIEQLSNPMVVDVYAHVQADLKQHILRS